MKSLNDTNEFSSLCKNIVEIVECGNRLDMAGKHAAAIDSYKSAWMKLPEPVEVWEEAHWIADCIIESYLKVKDPTAARAWCGVLLETMPSDMSVAAFISVGRVFLELDEPGEAYEYFKRAFEFGGKRAFQGYDPKCLEFYISRSKD